MAINRVSSSRHDQTARKQNESAFVMAPLGKLLVNLEELTVRILWAVWIWRIANLMTAKLYYSAPPTFFSLSFTEHWIPPKNKLIILSNAIQLNNSVNWMGTSANSLTLNDFELSE